MNKNIVYVVLNYDQPEAIFSEESEAEDYIRFYNPTWGCIEKIEIDEQVERNQFARKLEERGLYTFFVELPLDGSDLPSTMGYGSGMFDKIYPMPEITQEAKSVKLWDEGNFRTELQVLPMIIHAKTSEEAMKIAKERLTKWKESNESQR